MISIKKKLLISCLLLIVVMVISSSIEGYEVGISNTQTDKTQVDNRISFLKKNSRSLGIQVNSSSNEVTIFNKGQPFTFKILSYNKDKITIQNVVNGKTIEGGFESPTSSNSQSTQISSSVKTKTISTLSSNSAQTAYLPTSYWDGILSVNSPGASNYWIKYNHDDNIGGDVSPTAPSYLYPGDYNLNFGLWGNSFVHNHFSQAYMDNLASQANLNAALDLILVAVAAFIVAVPPFSWIVAAIGLIVGIIIGLLGISLVTFVNGTTAENGDGWTWARAGDWWACGLWCTHWRSFQIGFGGGFAGGFGGRDNMIYAQWIA